MWNYVEKEPNDTNFAFPRFFAREFTIQSSNMNASHVNNIMEDLLIEIFAIKVNITTIRSKIVTHVNAKGSASDKADIAALNFHTVQTSTKFYNCPTDATKYEQRVRAMKKIVSLINKIEDKKAKSEGILCLLFFV